MWRRRTSDRCHTVEDGRQILEAAGHDSLDQVAGEGTEMAFQGLRPHSKRGRLSDGGGSREQPGGAAFVSGKNLFSQPSLPDFRFASQEHSSELAPSSQPKLRSELCQFRVSTDYRRLPAHDGMVERRSPGVHHGDLEGFPDGVDPWSREPRISRSGHD